MAGRQRPLEPHLPRRALTLLAIGTAFRRREGSSVQANRSGTAGAQSTIASSTSPRTCSSASGTASRVTLGFSELDQNSLSNGNETQLDQNDITGALNYAFRLPRSLSRLRKQVRSSLTYLQTAAQTCLQQGGAVECIVISDVARRELRGGLDTDLLQTLTGGPPGGLLAQRRAASEPAHVADLDHRLVPALALRGRLSLTRRGRRPR